MKTEVIIINKLIMITKSSHHEHMVQLIIQMLIKPELIDQWWFSSDNYCSPSSVTFNELSREHIQDFFLFLQLQVSESLFSLVAAVFAYL